MFLTDDMHVVDFVQLEVYVKQQESTLSLKNLQFTSNVEVFLGTLRSLAELFLFGLGVGAVRYEEVLRLKLSSFQWHNGCLYYWTTSLKQSSMQRRLYRPQGDESETGNLRSKNIRYGINLLHGNLSNIT